MLLAVNKVTSLAAEREELAGENAQLEAQILECCSRADSKEAQLGNARRTLSRLRNNVDRMAAAEREHQLEASQLQSRLAQYEAAMLDSDDEDEEEDADEDADWTPAWKEAGTDMRNR